MNKLFSILMLVCFVLISSFSFGQKNDINPYKYILVPTQYEFQKSEDAFQVNSLTKFLFNRAGFSVFYTNEAFPADLANNGCKALKVFVENNSKLLSTKMQIKLVDCYNNVVYLTDEFTSREKDYKIAYHEVIRKAFEEIEGLNYKYTEPVIETKQEIVVVKELPKQIVKEVVNAIEDVQVKSSVEVAKVEDVKVDVKEVVPVIEKKKIVSVPKEEIKEIEIKPTNFSIEGKYSIEKWGICTISKNDEGYALSGGDENFEFAVVYKTSKPTIFIIKYAAYKQPQMVELDSNGNLNVDTDNTVKVYKRVN